jgi:hypothetical protein
MAYLKRALLVNQKIADKYHWSLSVCQHGRNEEVILEFDVEMNKVVVQWMP